jgi:hypothetical protein
MQVEGEPRSDEHIGCERRELSQYESTERQEKSPLTSDTLCQSVHRLVGRTVATNVLLVEDSELDTVVCRENELATLQLERYHGDVQFRRPMTWSAKPMKANT